VRIVRFEFGSVIWSYVVSSHFDVIRQGGGELIIKKDGKMTLVIKNVRDIGYLNRLFF
jgi:hypothetical protein